MKTVDKVVAYATCGDELLVFEQPNSPEAGIQVPAGTVQPGERLEHAVLRELHEESGLSNFGRVRYIDSADFDMTPFGKRELHRRHFFVVQVMPPVVAYWEHIETSGGTAAPQVFALRWVPLADPPNLIAGQGHFLPRLVPESTASARPKGC